MPLRDRFFGSGIGSGQILDLLVGVIIDRQILGDFPLRLAGQSGNLLLRQAVLVAQTTQRRRHISRAEFGPLPVVDDLIDQKFLARRALNPTREFLDAELHRGLKATAAVDDAVHLLLVVPPNR
ncbi:MAG: hypothetical protein JNM18_03900 [Planctomycetaceae bacterium]|nr:hypothetical protein [Planctomycetaceae bacterium]